MNPIIENVSFDGEQYTFANNPIGLTADDLYAAMIGFWTGGILGGGSDTIVDVSTTARLNTMMGNVRQNGGSMGVSDRSIRLAQDLTLLTNQDVSFTQGQTQVNADGSIAINKDSATPMQDVVAQMRENGLLPAQTKSKAQNRSTQTTVYTYEQLKNMSGSQVKAAYGEMVSKYAEHLKKFGFTDAQVKGYVHEALKTKTAENRISSVMRLQEEMGLRTEGDALSESNALQGDGDGGRIQEDNEPNIDATQSDHSNELFTELGEDQFAIHQWDDYPDGPRPEGPFKLIDGEEYVNARKAANKANKSLHRNNPESKGKQYHEIHTVKFGGSPTDINNKVLLTPEEHMYYTKWWNEIQRKREGKGKGGK